jgi:hypothetical protein
MRGFAKVAMRRRSFITGSLACFCAALTPDLNACGDKFLRAGRSVRGRRRYAALHPSSILIYRPAGSTEKGIRDFEKLLRGAGHTPRVLPREGDFAQALAAAKYDLLIADYGDARTIGNALDSVPARPTVLPLVLRKAAEGEARRDFSCLIKPYAMTEHEALAEIDRVIDRRLKNIPCGSS